MARLRFARCTFLIGLVFCLAGAVHAHDPGLSAIEIDMDNNQFTAHMSLARRDIESIVAIDIDLDGSVSSEELAAAHPRLETLARGAIEIRVDDKGVIVQMVEVELDENDELHVRLNLSPEAGTRLSLTVPIIAKLARGHRQYVSVRDDKGRTHTGILSAHQPVLELELQ